MLVAAGCGGTSSGSGGGDEAHARRLLHSARRRTRRSSRPSARPPAGEGVAFDQSYGASGEQARAVEGGLAADVVALSLAPDVNKLVKAGLVEDDWNKDEYNGFVTNSVVVFAVRKGNPKGIKTWDDLSKPRRRGDHAEPVHLGRRELEHHGGVRRAARAGQVRGRGRSSTCAACSSNVPVQDKSAREALQTFTAGKGDVLIAYENEAITAQQKGEDIDYVVPDETILIENPIAVTKDSKQPDKAQAFVDYTRSARGPEVFVDKGYRSVLPELADKKKYPEPAESVQDRQARRLDDGERQVLRSRQGRCSQDPEGAGGAH